jgi:preprotein translocase subunit YajC
VRNGTRATITLAGLAALLVGGAAEPALAQGGGRGGDVWGFVFMMAGMIAIFYFLLWRPQQKQRKEREAMLGALKSGDRVVTTSGIHGTITKLGEHTVILRVADQVKLELDRAAIGRVVPAGEKDGGG